MENHQVTTTRISTAARPETLPEPGCLHELFEAQVDRDPAAPALIWGDQSLNYGELDGRANQLARHLRAHGAGPGRFVGLLFERSLHPIVAILGCLKAGAAYVPLDPSSPADRIRHILLESETIILLTETSLAAKARDVFTGTVLDLDTTAGDTAPLSSRRLTRAESGVSPSDVCYVIYTSGTTGRPKGVMAEHRNAYLYTLAFNEVCGTTPRDRVYQGFALTFDGSVEEIWIAYSNGSALVAPTKDAPRFGNELAQYLEKFGVTYFSTVPTLLSTITAHVPTLRTVVVSGEACPAELVARWDRPGLRMLNVYGPTEATVNTSAVDCKAGQPVTIGKPLRGYDIDILDDNLNPVMHGDKGELFVSGPTLARGYLNQPELTAEKFMVVNGRRLYRTGDLVRWNANGDLEFFGRIDGQVKIRGYRVELAEIESILLENKRIRAAAVRLIERDGLQELAAYVTLDDSSVALDRAETLAQLEARVPVYMVPGFLDVLEDMPRLASGKIDRKLLPPPMAPLMRAVAKIVEAETPLEAKIAAVWAQLFNLPAVSVTADFFLDLGGHSLVAARMVTHLRQETNRQATVREAYAYPTVRKLAAHLQTQPEIGAPGATPAIDDTVTPSSRSVFQSLPRALRLTTAALQAVSITALYGLGSIPFVALFLVGLGWIRDEVSLARLIVSSIGVAVATWPLMLLVGIAGKWLIVGRYKPGRYPLWGLSHFRWWLSGRIQAFTGAGMLVGTPLLPLYLRLMGAKVGRGCQLDTAAFGTYDLLTIGDDTSIGTDSQVPGYRIENGMLILGTAEIGSRCFIGIHSALGLNTKMGDDSRLDDQSFLPDGQTVAVGESQRGSPAQAGEVRVPDAGSRLKHPIAFGLLQLVLVELLGLAGLVPLIPFLILYYHAFADYGVIVGAGALIASVPVGVVMTCLWLAALKKVVLPRIEPGVYPIESVTYLRKWLSDGIMAASRTLLRPVYTTLYLPPWLRLMGAKIGARAELSTVWAFAPELIDVGDESFFADGSIIGGKRSYRGVFQIGINRIGRRSFVGNSAILPVGQSLGDNCLLGVQSIPPTSKDVSGEAGCLYNDCTPDGTEWLGSPSFSLPNRPKIGSFDTATTYKPTRKLYAQRAVIDGLRILIPGYMGLAAMVAGALSLVILHDAFGVGAVFVAAPLVGLALAFWAAGMVIALKRLVMGTFKPVIVPLWSKYVWLNEMVNGAYESVMSPAIAPLLGTPFVAPFLRAIGCKIGKHTYIETTLFSEWDLVEVGDYAALNSGAIIQNHLFEDRVMKSSYLKIGDECSVGNMAVVLYDAEMKKGSVLAPLSLLLKGETLPPRTRWHGIPTTQVREPLKVWENESLGFHFRRPSFRRKRRPDSINHVAREVLG